MQKDYINIQQLIENSNIPLDLLKELCEAFLEVNCHQEGMVLYSKLIRQIADKEGFELS